MSEPGIDPVLDALNEVIAYQTEKLSDDRRRLPRDNELGLSAFAAETQIHKIIPIKSLPKIGFTTPYKFASHGRNSLHARKAQEAKPNV